MTPEHDTFTLIRDFAAAPADVFALWSDPEKKRLWFVDSDAPQWQERDYTMDFRVGGGETGRFVLTEGPGAGEHRNVTHYLDIEPDARIVYAYTMAMNGRIHSASLTTVTFDLHDGGTRLTYCEQMTLIGESDGAAGRTHGWTHLLDALERIAVQFADAD